MLLPKTEESKNTPTVMAIYYVIPIPFWSAQIPESANPPIKRHRLKMQWNSKKKALSPRGARRKKPWFQRVEVNLSSRRCVKRV
jgi:hypothetical protein